MSGDSPGRATGAFPDVRYADADGVSIAYSVRGDGPLDLVMVPGNLSGILSCTVDPDVETWLVKLARFAHTRATTTTTFRWLASWTLVVVRLVLSSPVADGILT